MWKIIEKLMKKQNLTMYALSKKADIGQSTLINLKAGRIKTLTFETICKLADALEVSLDEFRKDKK